LYGAALAALGTGVLGVAGGLALIVLGIRSRRRPRPAPPTPTAVPVSVG
jgi:hypothetical protein